VAPDTTSKKASRFRVVPALGVIEIAAWGSSYYLMTVLAPAISADTGWSIGAVTGGVSTGLVVSGLAAPTVGRLVRTFGGARVMAMGAVALASGLAALASSVTLAMFLGAWVVIGLGMSATLYDAAFATLGQIFGKDARSAITQLTLWGGFASTICWPLTAFLLAHLGWRGTCLVYAGLHLVLTLPLSAGLLPRGSAPSVQASFAKTDLVPPPSLLDPRILLFAATGICLTFLATAFFLNLVVLLSGVGYSMSATITLGTLIGPAQVGARFLEMLGRGRHHPIWTLVASTGLVLGGLIGIVLGVPAFLALVIYGGGNGLWSISRGAVPLAIFGPFHYSTTLGRLALPFLLSGASAPYLGALLIGSLGPQTALIAFCAIAMVPVAAVTALATIVTRGRSEQPLPYNPRK